MIDRRHRLGDPEKGSQAPMFAVVLATLVLMIGLVVDGGAALRAADNAQAAAEQAARAGAQSIVVSQAMAGQRPNIDVGPATRAAQATLDAAGVTGTITIIGDRIEVTTKATTSTTMLAAIGVSTLSGSGSASARIARGVTEEIP